VEGYQKRNTRKESSIQEKESLSFFLKEGGGRESIAGSQVFEKCGVPSRTGKKGKDKGRIDSARRKEKTEKSEYQEEGGGISLRGGGGGWFFSFSRRLLTPGKEVIKEREMLDFSRICEKTWGFFGGERSSSNWGGGKILP